MREGKPTFVVVDVPEDGSGDEQVVGFAQWELPSQATPFAAGAAVEVEPDQVPASLDQEKLLEMYQIIVEETKKALGPEGYSNMWCKSPCSRTPWPELRLTIPFNTRPHVCRS
jgi:hypothetical protein